MQLIKLNQSKQTPLDKITLDTLKEFKALIILDNMENYKIDVGLIQQLRIGSLSKMNSILISEVKIDKYWFR